MCVRINNIPLVLNLVKMASKSIIAYLNKGEKLDGDNYDIWHRKIRYVLNEQELAQERSFCALHIIKQHEQ